MNPNPEVLTSIGALRARLTRERADGKTVGFVPTMGALHDGHGSLIDSARSADDVVVVSIFVNPLQFGPDEDLDAYPRDLAVDVAVAGEWGADLVFAPSVREMYPEPMATVVEVPELAAPLDGAARPGHFRGVATVVAKLFAIVGPCRAYFGEKDWQQVAVITRMAADLSLPVHVVPCPTRRADDGLALSSRNVYLTEQERAAAPVLHRALRAGAEAVRGGELDPAAVEAVMAAVVAEEPLGSLDYVAAVPADTLVADGPLSGAVRLLLAVQFGRARLIDNLGCHASR